MPELPEVETVRRGLARVMDDATILAVDLRRPDLRFPIPKGFAERLRGARIGALRRRGKYLLAPLSTGETMIAHLGMSGRFSINAGGAAAAPGAFVHNQTRLVDHDHLAFSLKTPNSGAVSVIYNDPRRFGFVDLVNSEEVDECRHFKAMGPEPLSDAFTAAVLREALRGKSAPIKTALLDQRVVAGLGNIYVCEALFRAGISPRRQAGRISAARIALLHNAIVAVLEAAIDAGGSSLRDFSSATDELGYFQHQFLVYGRENEACIACERPIRRIEQGGRSTFYCTRCQT